MKRLAIAVLFLSACRDTGPEERYGFIARLGRDTVSVEDVTRRGNKLVSDEVDRFPRVRRRHTEIELADDGSIRRLVMDIHTPSEPENQRDRRVEAEVRGTNVRVTKKDNFGTVTRTFQNDGVAMAHLPQMYSLYELYIAAAMRKGAATNAGDGKWIGMRQFYIDREFDNVPLHRGNVRRMADGTVEIRHDWLSGTGSATLDSVYRLVRYSGAGTTYKVDVARLAEPPNVKVIGERFAAAEASAGAAKSLSVRDTTRATIGSATFEVDYSRPLARGRQLLGDVVPYGQVWRTGANAATQFSTTAPINLAGIPVPAGKYTLWTIPTAQGVTLIVNTQTGQWGTGYNSARDLARAPLITEMVTNQVEKFTISIRSDNSRSGALVMEWGSFRGSAPITAAR